MATTMRRLKDLGTHAREIKIEAAQSTKYDVIMS